jgi:hypothetical protein
MPLAMITTSAVSVMASRSYELIRRKHKDEALKSKGSRLTEWKV